MEQDLDAAEVLETPAIEEPVQLDEQLTPEEIKALQEKASRVDDLEGKNKQLFERLKKGEDKGVPSDGLSNKDVLYLAKADIPSEDMDDVVNYAKKMGVGMPEAHKFYTPILKERAEERRTAAATNTRVTARTTQTNTNASVLSRAQGGEILDSAEDMQAIFAARQDSRKRK